MPRYASPDLIYDTMIAPPVERIERRYSLDEIRYSAGVRQRMPSIDLDTINFETGSWEIPPDQAAKLQGIADGLNRAIAANPRAVFLIEGHTDAVGSDVDNLSLSDRRAESAAELLTQQFQVPAENLTSQGYGEQYLKVPTQGPERAQSPRHHPQHHAPAQWRHGLAAAAAARHRAAALNRASRSMKNGREQSRPFFCAIRRSSPAAAHGLADRRHMAVIGSAAAAEDAHRRETSAGARRSGGRGRSDRRHRASPIRRARRGSSSRHSP